MKITQQQYLDMCAATVAGIAANPASGNLTNDPYTIQNIVQIVLGSVQQALVMGNIQIEDPEDKAPY